MRSVGEWVFEVRCLTCWLIIRCSYTEPRHHHNADTRVNVDERVFERDSRTINIPVSTSQDDRVKTTFIEKDRIITQEPHRDQVHHKVDMGFYDEDGHYHSYVKLNPFIVHTLSLIHI